MKTLGIDLSTQSCTLCLLDAKSGTVQTVSQSYSTLPAIKSSPMDRETLLIPAPAGCAEQDPLVFLEALESCLEQLKPFLPLVVSIQISAQQHGHLYLNDRFSQIVQNLPGGKNLSQALAGTYAHPYAPIWRSSDTFSQAEALRQAVGGKDSMIGLTGSDSPLRFTGAVIKKFANTKPEVYQNSTQILLLNTWLACILSGNPAVPCDYANASGMSLMDYSTKSWSPVLLKAVGQGLKQKLGALASPQTQAGLINPYFQKNYGFSAQCTVGIGTGDNPATKVLSGGDILSLGTSFVYMKNTALDARDPSGAANAMFDGLGDPFTIFCRTNGAMVWDKVRSLYGADIPAASEILRDNQKAMPLCLWQPEAESLPLSPAFPLKRFQEASLLGDYKGIILSSLSLLQISTEKFGSPNSLAVTGGPSADREILALAASLWECPVTVLPAGGAALGAALSALALTDPSANLDTFRQKLALGQPALPRNLSAFRSYKKELLTHFQGIIRS